MGLQRLDRDKLGRYRGGGRRAVAQEDFVPASDLERFMNRRRVKVVFGADATVAARTGIETGLSMELSGDQNWTGFKWVLYGAIFSPSKLADCPGLLTGGKIVCQLQDRFDPTLADVAELDGDDPQLIAQCMVDVDLVTEGGLGIAYPVALDVVHPMPILNDKIQAVMVSIDQAAFNTHAWIVSLFWALHPLAAGDVSALLQAMRRND